MDEKSINMNDGLITTSKRFRSYEPDKGHKLSSFCEPWFLQYNLTTWVAGDDYMSPTFLFFCSFGWKSFLSYHWYYTRKYGGYHTSSR